MTLKEIVYQIDGELMFGECEGRISVSLLDKVREICLIERCDRLGCEAVTLGDTAEEACQKLVDLLKGSLLVHSWPVMWKTHATTIRVPETLTTDAKAE